MAPQYALRPGVWRRSYLFGLALVLGVMLAGPVCHAARSELPLGGDHGAYDGIDRLAGYLREEVEPGSTVYHHWLGYHYRFYLYGATLRLHWYPDLTDLVKDAVVYRNEPRYIAYPSWRDNRATKIALEKAGITMTPVLETTRRDGTTSLRLYRLEGPPNGSS